MLHLKSVDLKQQKIETLAIPVCEDEDIHSDPAIQRVIKKAFKLKEFNGKKDDEVTFYDISEINSRRVMRQASSKRSSPLWWMSSLAMKVS